MREFPVRFDEAVDVPPGAVAVLSAGELDEPRFKLYLLREDNDTDVEWKQAVKKHEKEHDDRKREKEAREHLLKPR